MASLNIEEFRHAVFQIVSLIPEGRATSYGAIAKAIGYPNFSRLVGKVLAGASGRAIPAHRVVNSQGILSGKDAFETSATMQRLLEGEGVKIRNNKIINWKSIYWNPIEEINNPE